MQGQLLDYSIQENIGYISGEDGKRYQFAGAEWKESRAPKKGDYLDFDVNATGQAVSVFYALKQDAGKNQMAVPNPDMQAVYEAEAKYNLFDWFMKCMKKCIVFSGRARRKEYWYFYLCYTILIIPVSFFVTIIVIILGVGILGLDRTASDVFNYVVVDIVSIVSWFFSIAVSVRRLHDINRSGWWYLFGIIPVIGWITLIVFYVTDTKYETNKWGPPAKPGKN